MHIIANPNHLIVSVSKLFKYIEEPVLLEALGEDFRAATGRRGEVYLRRFCLLHQYIRNDLADKLLLVHVTVIQAIQEGQLFVIFIAMRYRVVGQVDGIGYGTQRLQGCGDIVTVL